jgi:hypothetical protein
MESRHEVVEQLVLQYRRTRSDEVWSKLEKEFAEGIFFQARRWWVAGWDAEDVEQSLRLMLLQAVDGWREEKGQRFRNYFWTIAKRCMQDLIGWSKTLDVKNECQYPMSEEGIEWEPADTRSYDDLWKIEMDISIEGFHLTERQRVVLIGLILGKEKFEIAKDCNVSPSAVTWEVKALAKNIELSEYFFG